MSAAASRLFEFPVLLRWGLVASGLICGADPASASGPYLTDDSSITPVGTSQIEAWAALSGPFRLVNVVPATALTALPGVEWSLALMAMQAPAPEDHALTVTSRSATAQAKWQLREAGARTVGLSFAANATIDADQGAVTGLAAYGAMTVPVGADLLLHGNLGWTRATQTPRSSALTWGVRAETTLVPDRLVLHAEMFGAGAAGDAIQIGLRPTNRKGNVDLEFVVSRNLTGERRTWATIGFASRF